jgi:hypothetical protein
MPVAGGLITETFDYDGGREVTVYLPPERPEAVVFAGDGQLISRWGGVVEAAGVPSTMIVGAHRLADEMLRLQEYSPGFAPERFAAHERFLVETCAGGCRTRFGVARPATVPRCSVSRRAESSRSPSDCGIRMSTARSSAPHLVGGYRPPRIMPSVIPRTYLVAGTQEPFFLNNAARWAGSLRAAGADVLMTERHGSHGDAFWQEEFPLMVAWAFGP